MISRYFLAPQAGVEIHAQPEAKRDKKRSARRRRLSSCLPDSSMGHRLFGTRWWRRREWAKITFNAWLKVAWWNVGEPHKSPALANPVPERCRQITSALADN